MLAAIQPPERLYSFAESLAVGESSGFSMSSLEFNFITLHLSLLN